MNIRLPVSFRPSTLYGRIVLVLLSVSLIFFSLVAGLLYFITTQYMQDIISKCGSRVITVVETGLHHSMIAEDHTLIHEEIAVLGAMPGLNGIHLYDQNGFKRYSSSPAISPVDDKVNSGPCKRCHPTDTPTRMEAQHTCIYIDKSGEARQLTLLAPVLNEPTCSDASCHVHPESQTMLGILEVQLSLADLDMATRRTLMDYGLIVIAVMLITTIYVLYFSKYRIAGPLRKIITASREVSKGDLDLRLDLESSGLTDIQQVERTFNEMLDTIKSRDKELRRWSRDLEQKVRERTEDLQRTHQELYHIERMASLGKLSSSVVHEINNPLSGVVTYTKLVARLLQKLDLPEDRTETLQKHLSMIESETKRCGNIVKGLLGFSREGRGNREMVHLDPVLREVEQLMDHSFHMADVVLETEFSATEDKLSANPGQIKQACMAVLLNALEAVEPHEGLVLFRSFNTADGAYCIQIRDNGAGIDPEDQEHIFEPFFSTKKETSGIGLGLAVTYGIVKRHDGEISVGCIPGKATTFTIKLPVNAQKEGEEDDTST